MSLRDLFINAEQHPAYWTQKLYMSFLQDLTEAMAEVGMTHSQLAETLGAKRPWVTRLFNSCRKGNVTIHTIARLALAVGRRPVLVCLRPGEQVSVVTDRSTTATTTATMATSPASSVSSPP